ncbi:MAG: hypothetical protein ACHQ2Z_01730 [Elusimicrobiota bacterium]
MSGGPDAIPAERQDVAHRWQDQRRRLEQDGSGESRAWDRLYVTEDGAVSAFYTDGGWVFEYPLDGKSEPRRMFPSEPSREIKESDVLQHLGSSGTFLLISETGNTLDPYPDRLFEAEGGLVSALRDRGVRGGTINKITSLFRPMDGLIGFDGKSTVFASEAYHRFLLETLVLAGAGHADEESVLDGYLKGRLYRSQARGDLRTHPALIARIAAHPSFPRWAKALRETYLPAHGYSDSFTAENLILETLYRRFQGGRGSGSLGAALAEIDSALQDAPGYGTMTTRSLRPMPPPALASGLPIPTDAELDSAADTARGDVAARSGFLERSLTRIGETLRILPKQNGPGASSDKLDVVERFYRQTGVENSGGWSNESRYRYTVDRLFSGSSYYPHQAPLPSITEPSAPGPAIRDSLRFQLSGNRRYQDFEDKFAGERGTVREFLAASDTPAFPGFGSLLRRTIEPGSVLLDTLASPHPFVINRFFKDYQDWKEMAWNRAAFDFVRGVELQLLKGTNYARFLLRLASNWKPEDFSRASDADIDRAIERTLRIGGVRSKNMLGVRRTLPEYRFKDAKDFFKKIIFKYIPKTKFLRHRFDWNSYFGVGWTCMCWARESLFRVTFKK